MVALPQCAMQLEAAIPILRIFSVDKAKEFYVGFLGFSVDWEHRFGDNSRCMPSSAVRA